MGDPLHCPGTFVSVAIGKDWLTDRFPKELIRLIALYTCIRSTLTRRFDSMCSFLTGWVGGLFFLA